MGMLRLRLSNRAIAVLHVVSLVSTEAIVTTALHFIWNAKKWMLDKKTLTVSNYLSHNGRRIGFSF